MATLLAQVGFVKPSAAGGFTGALVLEKLDDKKHWKLRSPLTFESVDNPLPSALATVLEDTTTDLASVPQCFSWFVPRYGVYTKAAVLHDWLCDQTAKAKTRKERADGRFDADLRFREIMQVARVPLLRRWFMWSAVTWATVFRRYIRALPMLILGTVLLLGAGPVVSMRLVHVVGWVLDFVIGWAGIPAIGRLTQASWELGTWTVNLGLAYGLSLLVVLLSNWRLLPRLISCTVYTAIGMPFILIGLVLGAVLAVEQLVENVSECVWRSIRGQ